MTDQKVYSILSPLPPMQWGKTEISGPRHEFREDLLFKTFRKYLNKGKVLDAGCGSGSMLMRLLKDGYRVEGIEASEEFVELINRRIKDLGFKERDIVKAGSLTDLPYPDSHFDGLIAGEVLEHVEDDKKAVKEFWRVLKNGGVCVVSVPAHPHLWDISDEWAGHLRRYSKEGITNLFEGNGFRIEEVFFWGFPLVRLYNNFIFLRWVRREGAREATKRTNPIANKGLLRVLSKILSIVFRFDNLFNSLPWGIGIILCARKI